MGQKPVELILLRQFATHLGLPVILFDADGALVFYNDPAAELMGFATNPPGEQPLLEYSASIRPSHPDGSPIAPEDLPVAVALRQRRPQQAQLCVEDRSGARHLITTTALPLDGQSGVPLGAMSIFWEEEVPPPPPRGTTPQPPAGPER